MRKIWILFILLFIAAGCSSKELEDTSVEIEWAHFIQWNGKEYTALYDEIITDESFIGDELGEVAFTLNKEVTDNHYEVEDGDAAYLDVGTKLYDLPGQDNLLLAEANGDVRSYHLFANEEYGGMSFTDAIEKAVSIEVWEALEFGAAYKEMFTLDDVDGFVEALLEGEETEEPYASENERYFTFVLKTEDVLSYTITAQYADSTWYAVVNDEWVEADLQPWLAEVS